MRVQVNADSPWSLNVGSPGVSGTWPSIKSGTFLRLWKESWRVIGSSGRRGRREEAAVWWMTDQAGRFLSLAPPFVLPVTELAVACPGWGWGGARQEGFRAGAPALGLPFQPPLSHPTFEMLRERWSMVGCDHACLLNSLSQMFSWNTWMAVL